MHRVAWCCMKLFLEEVIVIYFFASTLWNVSMLLWATSCHFTLCFVNDILVEKWKWKGEFIYICFLSISRSLQDFLFFFFSWHGRPPSPQRVTLIWSSTRKETVFVSLLFLVMDFFVLPVNKVSYVCTVHTIRQRSQSPTACQDSFWECVHILSEEKWNISFLSSLGFSRIIFTFSIP